MAEKMTVRLLTGRASEDRVYNPGDEVTLDAAEAKRLLDMGQAEPVTRKTIEKAEKRGSGRAVAEAR